jgi:low temperature requirement protein LtrA
MMDAMTGSVLRDRTPPEAPPVTSVELFFDLVYVFAVTQLSQHLAHDLTGRGAVETLVLFLAVWWAWNYTAWATNWIDPDHPAVRVLMLLLMLISLVMSVKIPRAFGDEGVGFAAGYVAIQVVRGAFMVVALRGQSMSRNYAQLLAWSCIAGVVWLVGAFLHGDARLLTWILALAIDYAAPWHGFVLPGLGRTPTRAWTLAGGHLAERNQLVVLIALGESILALGKTFSELHADVPVVTAFVAGFVGIVSLWWVYFVRHAEEAARTISRSVDPTRIGRLGYAYAHAIMVAGVIVLAVAIERTMVDPGAETTGATAAVILGGPALYLAGNALFNLALTGRPPPSRLVGIVLLALLVPLAEVVQPLVLGLAATLVVLGLALATGAPGFRVPRPGHDRRMRDDEQHLAEEARRSREETEELREESESEDTGNPWAKTSSGDADNVSEDK